MNERSFIVKLFSQMKVEQPLARETLGAPPDDAKAAAEGALPSHKQAGLGHGKAWPGRLVDPPQVPRWCSSAC
jgi:hypothetical protein